MKWITRAELHVDRTACGWLIKNYIDPDAEFTFVRPDEDQRQLDGHSFDIRDGEYTHTEGKCTFEVLLERHGLAKDLALVEMGRIIREADVPSRRTVAKEGPGLDALMRGFQVSVADDYEKLRQTAVIYSALYAYCREKVATNKVRKQGTPRPRLRYSQRMLAHLDERPQNGPDEHE